MSALAAPVSSLDHPMTSTARPAPGRPAVVLLSGGLDSATCLAIARDEGFVVHALSFRYGQRHDIEVTAAVGLAAAAGVEHLIVDLDLRTFGASALTADLEVPKHETVDELGAAPDDAMIPITYVPARNTIFLSYALALAEVREARDVFIGVNALDYSGYPDCRPEYIESFETMANLATRAGMTSGGDADRLRIHTPLIDLTKAEIITRGIALGVDHSATTSCYDPVVDHPVDRAFDRTWHPGVDPTGEPLPPRPTWRACGHCDSCLLRRKGFADAGLTDPIAYVDPET